jgi:hypothetical protein
LPENLKNHSIIFILESEGQLTGSDCCGKLEGDWRLEQGQSIFNQQRKVITDVAPLFLVIREKYQDKFDISQVDPRNQLFLFPKIVSLILHFKHFSLASLRGLFMIYRLPAIIINGEVKYSGQLPTEAELIAHLDRILSK